MGSDDQSARRGESDRSDHGERIDPDSGTTSTFSISGGSDQEFPNCSCTGVLSFLSAPDFENPTDAGTDNGYEVTIRASDGSLHDEQTITVTVTDAFENTGPSNLVASVLTVVENEAIGTLVGSFNGPIRMRGRP